MSKLDAKVQTRWQFGGTVRGSDGYEVTFLMDDSLRSWRQIVRWNLHYHHWAALRANACDLITKVLWRKLWRRSS